MQKLKFEPERLITIAKMRDGKRAIARDLNDQYQGLREERDDKRRRADLARANALALRGPAHDAAMEQADRLDKEAAGVLSRMRELQAEIDAQGAEAVDAARLLSACLRFAKAELLEIPASLKVEAERIDMMGAL